MMPASQIASFSSAVVATGVLSLVAPSPLGSLVVTTLEQASPSHEYVTTVRHASVKVPASSAFVSALYPFSQHTPASVTVALVLT